MRNSTFGGGAQKKPEVCHKKTKNLPVDPKVSFEAKTRSQRATRAQDMPTLALPLPW